MCFSFGLSCVKLNRVSLSAVQESQVELNPTGIAYENVF